MTDIETIDIYYPPEPLEANKVGKVEISRGDKTTLHMTFLGEPLGKDTVIAGRLLRERRTQWATNRAIRKVRFQAELQLESDRHDHMPVTLTP